MEQKKKEQLNPKPAEGRQQQRLRAKINEIDNRKTIKKINETKSCFLEKDK